MSTASLGHLSCVFKENKNHFKSEWNNLGFHSVRHTEIVIIYSKCSFTIQDSPFLRFDILMSYQYIK